MGVSHAPFGFQRHLNFSPMFCYNRNNLGMSVGRDSAFYLKPCGYGQGHKAAKPQFKLSPCALDNNAIFSLGYYLLQLP